MEFVDVPVTDRADIMSFRNGTAVIVRAFNVNNYRWAAVATRIEQIEDP